MRGTVRPGDLQAPLYGKGANNVFVEQLSERERDRLNIDIALKTAIQELLFLDNQINAILGNFVGLKHAKVIAHREAMVNVKARLRDLINLKLSKSHDKRRRQS